MKKISCILTFIAVCFISVSVFSQSVKQKGACGAIYVRVVQETKKIEIEQLPIVLQGHKTLDRDHLLTFDNNEEINVFIKMLQNCNDTKQEVENQRFEMLYMKDTNIIAFGHAEDKYTTKDITINSNDIPKLIAALKEIIK
jgi:hypothetical protein